MGLMNHRPEGQEGFMHFSQNKTPIYLTELEEIYRQLLPMVYAAQNGFLEALSEAHQQIRNEAMGDFLQKYEAHAQEVAEKLEAILTRVGAPTEIESEEMIILRERLENVLEEGHLPEVQLVGVTAFLLQGHSWLIGCYRSLCHLSTCLHLFEDRDEWQRMHQAAESFQERIMTLSEKLAKGLHQDHPLAHSTFAANN